MSTAAIPTAARPVPMRYRPIRTVPDLARHLQWAMSVELSTVPPYLTALYSITDNSADAYRLIRSVAIEEMLHMMLVANLLNSIGTVPDLTGDDVVPSYPGYIPHHAAGGPYIQLQALSPGLARSVFMAIEQPEASPCAPAEGDDFQTIGQFYKAIEEGFEYCVKEFGHEGVFGKGTPYQRDDTYFGSGGGHLVVVHDLAGAKLAINEIVEQGEGATHPQPPTPGEEPFGGYEHYGERLDGTYGPILGVPWELSHYRKFEQIATGAVPTPDVYPMRANPSPDDLEGDLRRAANLFDDCYGLTLRALEGALGSPAEPTDFFGVAFPVMHFALPPLAQLLMQTPLEAAADPAYGPNAGPAWRYRAGRLDAILREAEALLAADPGRGETYLRLWRQSLGRVVETLRGACRAAEGSDL